MVFKFATFDPAQDPNAFNPAFPPTPPLSPATSLCQCQPCTVAYTFTRAIICRRRRCRPSGEAVRPGPLDPPHAVPLLQPPHGPVGVARLGGGRFPPEVRGTAAVPGPARARGGLGGAGDGGVLQDVRGGEPDRRGSGEDMRRVGGSLVRRESEAPRDHVTSYCVAASGLEFVSTATTLPRATEISQQQQVHVTQASEQSSQVSGGLCPQVATDVLRAGESAAHGSNGCISYATTGAVAAELQYVTVVLTHVGIDGHTTLWSFMGRFCPSQPLDPSIFGHLELFFNASSIDGNASSPTEILTGQLHARRNRKLLFDLLGELLVEVMWPYPNLRTLAGRVERHGYSHCHKNGSSLFNVLCTKIKSFPRIDFQNVEDIDALSRTDDESHMKHQSSRSYEEELYQLVSDMERLIFGMLVTEVAVALSSFKARMGGQWTKDQRNGKWRSGGPADGDGCGYPSIAVHDRDWRGQDPDGHKKPQRAINKFFFFGLKLLRVQKLKKNREIRSKPTATIS